jgi:hypothetical protein
MKFWKFLNLLNPFDVALYPFTINILILTLNLFNLNKDLKLNRKKPSIKTVWSEKTNFNFYFFEFCDNESLIMISFPCPKIVSSVYNEVACVNVISLANSFEEIRLMNNSLLNIYYEEKKKTFIK